MLVYCTLFNSYYLDKGIAMYHSLLRQTKDFRLYIVAFDKVCYDILLDMQEPQLKVISLEEFETDELLRVKQERTAQEYCWTCSCHTIKYVLDTFQEEHCTYIDADLYFYNDPHVLMDEILQSGCDVGIIGHRMPKSIETDRMIQLSGKYCIQYNTFLNNENGRKILEWWCDSCIECCTAVPDGQHFGDQKYLDDWLERFDGVHELSHLGAGVAPWNLSDYKMDMNKIVYKKQQKEIDLMFYHFQQIVYINNKLVDINVNLYPYKVDVKLLKRLYVPYLQELNSIRLNLKDKYHFDLYDKQKYYNRFNKFRYFTTDILRERNIKVFAGKIWRLIIRKDYDFLVIK